MLPVLSFITIRIAIKLMVKIKEFPLFIVVDSIIGTIQQAIEIVVMSESNNSSVCKQPKV